MKTKRVLLLGLALLSMIAANAQDLIVKQDGESIKAYRTDVGSNAVYYRLEDNDQAPVMMIDKSDVLVVKLQDGTVITMNETVSKKGEAEPKTGVIDLNNYVPNYPQEPVADPEMIANAEIGSLIEFYDGTKGIIFYLDGNGHGLAVYPYQINITWQNTTHWYNCIDIRDIPNERRVELQMGIGAEFCDAAIKQLGLDDLPAIDWCCSLAPGWYLPSLGELYQLIMIANKSKGANGPISKALKAVGGIGFYGTFSYISSTEEDDTTVSSISPFHGVETAKKYKWYYVRAIRMF